MQHIRAGHCRLSSPARLDQGEPAQPGQRSGMMAGAARLVLQSCLLAPLLLVAACSSGRGGSLPYDDQASLPAPDRLGSDSAAYDIPLGPLDVLRITVLRVPDLSGEFQVDAFGNIDLPLIGSVSVRDQRPDEFATRLEQLYGARYLNNPDVTLRVISGNGSNIVVEGGVYNPGVYALPGKTTLLGAIAIAKGVSEENGNPRRVAILRKRDGQTIAAAFDLVDIRHHKAVDPLVYPGDTVVVDSDNLRKTYRDLMQSLPLVAIFSRL